MTAQVPPGSRPRIQDVATLAGVSVGTVSHVLNHPDRVAAATLERVQRASKALGYLPNTVARSLQAGTTTTIGLIVSDLSNSLFVDIARGAEIRTEQHGLNLLIANSDGRVEREAAQLRMFVQSRAGGVLMTLNDAAHFLTVSRLAPQGVPLVLLNFQAPDSQFCSVDVDNRLGGYLATKHLIETGRRRLVFVGGPEQLRPVTDRGRGFLEAVGEHADVTARVVTPSQINRSDGWGVGRQLAPQIAAGEIDGVFASSDLLAAGVLHALTAEPGIRIPEDVAVVGYDNNQAAWDSPIPITTIAQPGEELGRLGAELLQAEISSQHAEHAHSAVVLPPHLVVRDSSRLAS